MTAAEHELAIVAIGRNEGARLERCLESCARVSALSVYVDSGSSDGSVERARELGAELVELDPRLPFTAARARNEGFARARSLSSGLRFVQFIDGDCELAEGWIDLARASLAADDSLVAVCGRRRERFPEASPYNRLCDMEWDTPIGEARAFGGDVMIRADAFVASGGYAGDLIAGEDPELAHRLRKAGGRVLRLDHDMSFHDAAMDRFGQWWRRSRRAGHAYAECWHRHRPSGFRSAELRSILFWGIGIPLLAFAASLAIGNLAWSVLAAYLVLFERVRRGRRRLAASARDAALYAASVVVGKWAQALGVVEYAWRRLRRQRSVIIEYKSGS